MAKSASVSIIVPARDEQGTIALIPDLVPKIGKEREFIFVEGHSKDNTWGEIKKLEKLVKSGTKIRAFRQEKHLKGKGNAVEIGFEKARGDILMIFDADLSTPPASLKDFYKLLVSGEADFVNGSRFVHPKEKGAMKYLNHLGNRFFALVFSLILRQKITDTLCGTKVFWRKDWKRIKKQTKEIKKDDPYGDFTLLLGAAKLGLKVGEIPVNYKARVYGKSKISPFFDGIKLIFLLGKDIKNYILSILS